MGLREYRTKRHFAKTPEPKGKKRKDKAGQRFVIQKHAARRLHYDFRLEIDGVLVSWAVPKGPSLDPAEKRLAAHVEDHPLEYRDFEGIIPQGEYGGGTVLVWDQGTWEADGDFASQYGRGRMKFRLNGEKLQGGWNLVRMKAKKPGADDWLLFKENDDAARPLSEFDVEQREPKSVLTGRTLEEIAAQADRVWHSNRDNGQAPVKPAARPQRRSPQPLQLSPGKVKGAKRGALPENIELQLATLRAHPPEGQGWIHEIKFDGYRMLCRLEKGKATLVTRKKLDWTHRFPDLAADLSTLPVKTALVDGEIVALRADGASDFGALQRSFTNNQTSHLTYSAFDLLYLDGYDLRHCRLLDRKQLLASILAAHASPRVQYVEHIEGQGAEFYLQCCRLGLEGAISKREDAAYEAGRTETWIKAKCKRRENFVIGGWVPSKKRSEGLGGLILGTYGLDGKLNYEGRAGTGFSVAVEADLLAEFKRLATNERPFAEQPPREGAKRLYWVRPDLVAHVEFAERTNDGRLRQASFQGLREDVPPESVVREETVDESKKTAVPQKKDAARREQAGDGRLAALTEEKLSQLKDVRLTHPKKVMYPRVGVTKLDLAEYYVLVADWMLPHVMHRPLSLVRCPDGAGGQCFYQKHADVGTPSALERISISVDKARRDYLMIENLAGLVSLVQMGILEIHPWGSRGDLLERPDRMFFDLDPDESVPWSRTVAAAHRVRELLKGLGFISFVKTTGGKGLHVIAPLERRYTWDEVKAFSQAVAKRMVAESPREFVATMAKAARKGKIYVDYLRNARGATAIAPYSTRRREDATVSMPLHWSEVSEKIAPDHFNVQNAVERLKSLPEDPWTEMANVKQGITNRARRSLNPSGV